jgi:hypothetical protein
VSPWGGRLTEGFGPDPTRPTTHNTREIVLVRPGLCPDIHFSVMRLTTHNPGLHPESELPSLCNTQQ